MAARDLIMWFMGPKTKAAAEAESRQWMATRANCNATDSVWDLGGLRYKAAGRPVMRIRCPHCGQTTTHNVVRVGTSKAA